MATRMPAPPPAMVSAAHFLATTATEADPAPPWAWVVLWAAGCGMSYGAWGKALGRFHGVTPAGDRAAFLEIGGESAGPHVLWDSPEEGWEVWFLGGWEGEAEVGPPR